MAYSRATPFLRDHRPILRFLEAFEEAHEDLETALRSRGGELSVAYGSGRIPESLQTRIDEIFSIASIREVVAPEGPEVDLGRDKDRRDLESIEKERRDQAYEELLEETGLPDRGFRASRAYNLALAEMISDIPFDEYLKQRGGAYHDVSHQAHYTLGYRSQAEVPDGTLRRIEVRLKSHRANLYYRTAIFSGPK